MASLEARAAEKVRITPLGSTRKFFLATSPGFSHVAADPKRSIEPESSEATAAQRAIVERVRHEFGIYRLDLQGWIHLASAAGGLPGLASRLLGEELTPELRKTKPYKAELRKLQEYAQGKYANVSTSTDAGKARRARIARLGGPGNPYSSIEQLREPLKGTTALIRIRADWKISETIYYFSSKGPHAEHYPSDLHDLLLEDEPDLIDFVANTTIDFEAMFALRVHSISIEISR